MDGQCGWGREQETTWNRLRNLTLISRVTRELLSREMWSDLFENDQVAAKGRAGGRESDPQEILEPCISNPPSHPFLLPWPHLGLCTAFTQPYPAPSWTCSVRSCPIIICCACGGRVPVKSLALIGYHGGQAVATCLQHSVQTE